jgi:hypothetical protein
MKVFLLKVTLLLSLTYLFGCSATEENKGTEIPYNKQIISPGACLIVGEIVDIDSTKLSKSSNNPCSKQPCWATVKIKSMLGCGAGAPIIGNNDMLKVKFNFTLGETTKELFPNLDKRMPGLKVNSKFKASIKELRVFNSGSKNEKLYQINTYEVIEKVK